MAAEDEIWKLIKDYPDYCVSNKGRVKSFKYGSSRILKPSIHDKYYRVELCKNGSSKRYYVHILVLKAFISSQPKRCVGNHKDGIKLNDNADNLEWITKSEDTKHAYKLGLCSSKGWCGGDRRGENNPRAKLNNDNVREIKRLLSLNVKQKDIAEIFRVCPSTISLISTEYNWTHIPFLKGGEMSIG